MPSRPASLLCPLCGFGHQPVPLRPGERALCRRCDTVIAHESGLGSDATLCFALTGLILSVPALMLPFITAGKFGQEQGGLLLSGVHGLWDNGMPVLAIWVLLCGIAVPLVLLIMLVAGLLRRRFGSDSPRGTFLSRAAHAMSYWAMPEVQVLAVLVALMKLGSLVNVSIGAGFWCYAGMSVCLLLAWRGLLLTPSDSPDGAEAIPAVAPTSVRIES